MDYKYYDNHINKKTKSRFDVTPLFRDPKIFSNLIIDLIKPFEDKKFNLVVGIDAIGFIIGGQLRTNWALVLSLQEKAESFQA